MSLFIELCQGEYNLRGTLTPVGILMFELLELLFPQTGPARAAIPNDSDYGIVLSTPETLSGFCVFRGLCTKEGVLSSGCLAMGPGARS